MSTAKIAGVICTQNFLERNEGETDFASDRDPKLADTDFLPR